MEKKVTKLPSAEIQESNQKLNRKITEKELKLGIKKLKRRKRIGFDQLINEMFKNAPDEVLKMPLMLFNVILKTGHLQEHWCKGPTEVLV